MLPLSSISVSSSDAPTALDICWASWCKAAAWLDGGGALVWAVVVVAVACFIELNELC